MGECLGDGGGWVLERYNVCVCVFVWVVCVWVCGCVGACLCMPEDQHHAFW